MKVEQRVGIVVLNWNSWRDTIFLLRQLLNIDCDKLTCFIVIVDNGSTDGSVNIISKWLGNYGINYSIINEDDIKSCNENNKMYRVVIIKNQNNYGYAGGMNRGIKFSLRCLGADYVALLNNDISVNKDFLVTMYKAFNHITTGKYIGIVGPRVLDFYTGIEVGQPQVYIPLPLISFLQRFFRTLVVSSEAYRTYNYISVNRLDGCCYLVMSKVFNDVGFLKEEYFMYWEDTVFFLRVKKKGYLLVFAPVSVVRHKIGGANIWMRRINPRASYYFARNMINFIKFNYNNIEKYIVYLGAILSLPVYLCINLCYYRNIQAFKYFLFGLIKGILGETGKSIL